MNSNIKWADTDQRIGVAKLYHKFGMMIARICGREDAPKSFKEPEETWDKQTLEVIETRDWENATGIDLILGVNDYRCIDIDDVDGPNHFGPEEEFLLDHAYSVRHNFICECLKQLGLPSTYEWIIKSPHGYHIIIRAKNIERMPPSIAYSPNKAFTKESAELMYFSRIELLWRTQAVMPPSNAIILPEEGKEGKASYKCYEFLNCFLPHNPPAYVEHSRIDNFLNFFCGETTFIHAVDYKYMIDYLSGAKFYQCCAKDKIDEGSWVTMEELLNPQFGSSQYPISIPHFEGLDGNINWLKACATPEAYNKLGIISQIVDHNTEEANQFFIKSNTEQAHYNIACLMARNYLSGTLEEMEEHLAKSSLPELYKNQLRLYYSLRHEEESNFVFVAMCTTAKRDEIQSIDSANPIPNLIQVSWIETDSFGNSLSSSNIYLPANSFDIPMHITRSGGLSTEQAKRYGDRAWGLRLLNLLNSFVSGNTVVCFDVPFCKEILKNTISNLDVNRWFPTPKVPQGWEDKEFVCIKATAAHSISDYSSKSVVPSFENIYEKVIGEEYADCKDSLYRAECLMRVFFKLKDEKCSFIKVV